jgi:hypothetical protein
MQLCSWNCASILRLFFAYLSLMSQEGLLEVSVIYLGSLGYFLTRGPVLPNGCSSEKLMLNGGPECAAYLA